MKVFLLLRQIGNNVCKILSFLSFNDSWISSGAKDFSLLGVERGSTGSFACFCKTVTELLSVKSLSSYNVYLLRQ